MTAILLHLNDQFNLENFSLLKQRIMIALTVCSTTIVTPYLTSQFYEKNYTVQQRVDILDVLESAARELSGVKVSLVI
jgi:hypothetical protein